MGTFNKELVLDKVKGELIIKSMTDPKKFKVLFEDEQEELKDSK